MFLEKEIIQRSGEPCQNGYVYTEEALRAIADQINSKPTFGTLGKMTESTSMFRRSRIRFLTPASRMETW